MKLYIKILSVTIGLLISSCGVSQADYEKLKAENVQLTKELEAFRISEGELVAETNMDAEEKERIRLANLNNTGIWTVRYYVDDFGEATTVGYITNTRRIRGSFSNSATQDSELDVTIAISTRDKVSIQLYEYAGSNPVKDISTFYNVLIQDKNGDRYNLRAKNYSDRLVFDKADSREVDTILYRGGLIKFMITEQERRSTQYNFTIQNADFYGNAYRIIEES